MNVTLAEFQYLKETLSKDLIAMLMEKRSMGMEEAFRWYYNSDIFKKISDPERDCFSKAQVMSIRI